MFFFHFETNARLQRRGCVRSARLDCRRDTVLFSGSMISRSTSLLIVLKPFGKFNPNRDNKEFLRICCPGLGFCPTGCLSVEKLIGACACKGPRSLLPNSVLWIPLKAASLVSTSPTSCNLRPLDPQLASIHLGTTPQIHHKHSHQPHHNELHFSFPIPEVVGDFLSRSSAAWWHIACCKLP
jgi:hypothetical protein